MSRALAVAAAVAIVLLAVPALAAERYALVVSGASGGPAYAAKYREWRMSLAAILTVTFGYPADHVRVLAEDEEGPLKATGLNVRAALDDLRRRAAKDDLVLIVLIGHGTAIDGDEGKFNLVGPDLTADEWARLVEPIAARLAFVNTTSGSYPFLRKLSAPERVVVTATDSAAQEFETVFPDYFIRGLEAEVADLDRNGRVSLWEAFVFASAGVKDWFEERGQLATERPLLDDTGDGVGREAGTPGPDGAVAQVAYLQPEAPIATTGDAELNALLGRRAALQAELEALKARKPLMPAGDYDTALERVLLDLARVEREIRKRS